MNVVMFPGQGSQSIGMGKDLYESSDIARNIINKADDILGYSLSKIMFEGPIDLLTKTIHAQPALVTVSYAMLMDYLHQKNKNIQSIASYALGHSLGEYTALAATQALSFEEVIKLVHIRGKAMQEAVPEGMGTMAAILGMTKEQLLPCLPDDDSCVIANDNAPGQIVISGYVNAVEACIENAKARGAKRAVILPVSAPFHSPLMKSAEEIMKKELSQVVFFPPVIPVISNVTAKPAESAEDLRINLEKQICGQVRFTESIQYASSQGINNFCEFGPGQVLTNLVKRIQPNATFQI